MSVVVRVRRQPATAIPVARGRAGLCRSETHRCCSEAVWRGIAVCWSPAWVIVSLVYRVVRKLLAVPAVLLRRDMAMDA
ncbi:integrase, partial [Streptomyces sp. WI04-05B]|nr:integrase [Streptomyces sp. WI04-05B]